MAIKKSVRANQTKPIVVTIGEDSMGIVYRPNLITSQYQKDATAYQKQQEKTLLAESGAAASGELSDEYQKAKTEAENDASFQGIVKQLLDLLVSWDYLGDDDKPLPITASEITGMDTGLLSAIFKAIMDDIGASAQTTVPDPNAPAPASI